MKHSKLIIIILFASGILSTRISATNWQKTSGPFQGGINRVHIDRINPAILYATTPFKILKTNDEGQNWQTLLEASKPIYIFALAPGNQNIIYTNSQKSVDAGQTWSAIQPVPYSKIEFDQQTPDDIENKLAIHPGDANILFAGLSSFGMYRSTDGAQSWNIIPGAPQGLIIFNEAKPTELFCAGSDSLYFSSNNGNNWTAMSAYPDAGNYTPKKIIYQDGTLFVLLASGVEQLQGQRIIRSKNNGIDWTVLTLNIPFAAYLNSINSIGYRDGNLLAATNIGLYRSVDEGQTWSRFSADFDDLNHVDLTNRVITGSRNFGVSATRDLNKNWQNIGIESIVSTEATVVNSSSGEIFLQWRGAIYRFNPDNYTWQTAIPPHSIIPGNSAISISNSDSTILFSVYSQQFLQYETAVDEWTVSGNSSETPAGKLVSGPNDEILFFLAENGHLYRSINAGISWGKLDTPIGETILDFHFSALKNLYLLTDLNYYSSVNLGASFQALRNGLPGTSLQSSEIWYDKRENDRLFLQVENKIYQKTAAAALWEIFYPQTSLIFPPVGTRIITYPDSNSTFYAIIPRYFDGANYLARYNSSRREWQPINTNFDSVSVRNFDFTHSSPHLLYHINGAGEFWLGDVHSNPDSINFTSARIQIFHNAADPLLDSLDLYLNNIKIADNIKFTQATPFVDLPAGTLIRLAAAPANSSSALDSLMSMMFTFDSQNTYFVNLTGVVDTTKFAVNPDNVSRALQFHFYDKGKEYSVASDKVNFNFQNNISDAPAIDLIARSLAQLADTIKYGQMSDYILLSPERYTFDLKPSLEDSSRLASFHLDLRGFGGKTFSLVASGFLDPAKNRNGVAVTLHEIYPSGQAVEVERESGAAGAPPKVILAAPANSAFNIALRPNLYWRPAANALSYHIQIDTHPSFSSVLFDANGITDTTVIVSGLAENQIYYWRVQAQNQSGPGLWSSVWHFTTTKSTATPASPVLLSPDTGAENIPTNVTFKWTAVDDAQNYTLEYSFSSLFSPALQLRNIPDTTFTVDTLQHNTTYYWHVRAVNTSGKSGWSTTNYFTTAKAPDPLALPQLLSPADSATNIFTNITLKWSPVPGAAYYSLEVSNDADFSPAIFYKAIADTFKRIYELNNATTYYWRVWAADSMRTSDWSDPFSFTTVPNYPLSFAVSETLKIPAFMKDDQLESSDYRIIGFPGNAQILIDSLFTGKQDSSWGVYWDNGALSNYLQPFDKSGTFNLQTGRAFWILHKGAISLNRKFKTAKLDSAGFVNIPVHVGWNLITNPFTSSISWELVKRYNEIYQPIWDYDGSFLEADSLVPFKGYYFFNINDLSNIKIPYDALFEADSSANKISKTSVQIRWVNEDGLRETIKLGFSQHAVEGLDKFDAAKPRSVNGMTGLYFARKNNPVKMQKLAIEYQPRSPQLQKWDFVIETDKAQHGVLEVVSEDEAFSLRHLYFCNQRTGKILQTDQNSRIPVKLVRGLNEWQLIAATESEFLDYQINSMRMPFRIEHPFPNPFSSQVRVRFLSKFSQKLRFEIFNIRGERVRTLFEGKVIPGWQEIIWEGKNALGTQCASGLYFITAEGSGQKFTKKVVLLH